MTQLIIEDIDTHQIHMDSNGLIENDLPQTGEEFFVFDEDDNGSVVIGGTVVSVSRSDAVVIDDHTDRTITVYVCKGPKPSALQYGGR